MSYLPFSNRFEKIFSESKELTSTWKLYEVEIRKVAGEISEYDRQIEAITRACKKDGEVYLYCPGTCLFLKSMSDRVGSDIERP